MLATCKFAQGYYRKNGRSTETSSLRLKCSLRYMREWYGKQPAVEFGPLALKAVRERMVDEDLSRGYINDHIDRIKRMFKWAVAEELDTSLGFSGSFSGRQDFARPIRSPGN